MVIKIYLKSNKPKHKFESESMLTIKQHITSFSELKDTVLKNRTHSRSPTFDEGLLPK